MSFLISLSFSLIPSFSALLFIFFTSIISLTFSISIYGIDQNCALSKQYVPFLSLNVTHKNRVSVKYSNISFLDENLQVLYEFNTNYNDILNNAAHNRKHISFLRDKFLSNFCLFSS